MIERCCESPADSDDVSTPCNKADHIFVCLPCMKAEHIFGGAHGYFSISVCVFGTPPCHQPFHSHLAALNPSLQMYPVSFKLCLQHQQSLETHVRKPCATQRRTENVYFELS